MRPLLLLRFLAFAILLLAPVVARAQQEVVGTFGDWSAFKDSEDGKPLCYIGSVPKKEEGDYTSRGKTYLLVTLRPAEKPFPVVTLESGFPFREGSTVSLTVDGKPFELFTRNRKTDGKGDAWAIGDDGDKALVAAMKAGQTLVARGVSSRGTETTDTYSLSGFTRALSAMEKACGK